MIYTGVKAYVMNSSK